MLQVIDDSAAYSAYTKSKKPSMKVLVLLSLLTAQLPLATGAYSPTSGGTKQARQQHEHPRAAFLATGIAGFGAMVPPAFASESNARNSRPLAATSTKQASSTAVDGSTQSTKTTIVYQPLTIDVDGIRVPVAAWQPSASESNDLVSNTANTKSNNVSYEHRISVSKIGRLLAGWNLPSFVDRNFSLRPGAQDENIQVTTGANNPQPLPQSAPVILLAHGYLGSRFDLSHLAEALASRGFLVLSPEYPESLAASYDAKESASGIPIDRTIITSQLLQTLTTQWNVEPKSYGIVGHSLGCGTADRTGDASWTRVLLAGGYPSLRGPNCLFVGSVNDGAVSVGRSLEALKENNFVFLDENTIRSQYRDTNNNNDKLPSKASLIFRNLNNAPNHISFLAEGTNDAMVEFLSPLLPLARTLGIPVLDFDKYQLSRDSRVTGETVIPLVVEYLMQKMM